MKEQDFIDNKELREECINRVEVLDKVGSLVLLPDTEFATTDQVAKYYEVDKTVIRQIIARNSDELKSDGLKYLKGKEIKEKLDTHDKMSQVSSQVKIKAVRGGMLINDTKIAYSKNALFTRRAILRVGMLLRDSEIAKEVRTYLLDIEYDIRKRNPEIIDNKINEMSEEQGLMLKRVEAEMNGDYDKVCAINAKLFALKNKRIQKLEMDIKNITTNSLTIIESKKIINRIVRTIGTVKYNGMIGKAWNELYSKVNYQLRINIKARGKTRGSYLNSLTDEEVLKLEKITRTWALDLGLNLEDLLKIS